jgi:hypothetical protein
MKNLFFLLIIGLFPFFGVMAQNVANDNNLAQVGMASVVEESATKIRTESNRYVFESNNQYLTPKGEIEPHFLGDDVAAKWTLVNELFLRKSEVSIGFGASYTETVKPSVLNALYKINAHFKKQVNKNSELKNELAQQFAHILTCAVAVYYADNSQQFEAELARSRDVKAVLSAFEKVELVALLY